MTVGYLPRGMGFAGFVSEPSSDLSLEENRWNGIQDCMSEAKTELKKNIKTMADRIEKETVEWHETSIESGFYDRVDKEKKILQELMQIQQEKMQLMTRFQKELLQAEAEIEDKATAYTQLHDTLMILFNTIDDDFNDMESFIQKAAEEAFTQLHHLADTLTKSLSQHSKEDKLAKLRKSLADMLN